MITGDQALTAKAIGERLEIIDKNGTAITGADLHNLSEEELQREAEKVFVYARVSPEQKLNIVKALQRNGEFVAMTGDGVNDAPSLKQADIGLAMGITGTDVAKDASDMILLDDNFATIVKAVKEGRRIYENIRKFILYILSCNLSEILTLLVAPLLGFAIPLLPIHILWINLVTDGLPGIELVAEPAEKGIMKYPPRPPKENLFAGGFAMRIILSGIVLTLAAIFIQWWAVGKGYDVITQQTMVFTALCFVQLANALSCRSFHHSLFAKGIFSNKAMWITIIITIILQILLIYVPFLHPVFKTTSLNREAITMIGLVSIISLLCIELLKFISNKIKRN
jgi:Ca2+-transporting ATPase